MLHAVVSLRRSLLFPAVCGAVAFCVWPRGTWAQSAAPSKTEREPATPASFDEALRTLPFAWDAQANGVLLSVGLNPSAEPRALGWRSNRTDSANFFSQGVHGEVVITPLANGSFSLAAIASAFERHIVKIGKVSVFAPNATATLARHLPAPDPYADMNLANKLRRLESTLTPAQWRLIASPTGLGSDDLRPDQKRLWVSLLPDRLNLSRAVYANGEPVPDERFEGYDTPLTPQARAGVRLSLYRVLSWATTTQSPPGDFPFGPPPSTDFLPPDGTTVLSLTEGTSLNGWTFEGRGAETFYLGANIRRVAPFVEKPSDLAYDGAALDARVSVAQVKTVGALISQIKAKTRVDLFCDPRYRELAVTARAEIGQTVRAGDLLRAIALGVTGTFRRVSAGRSAAYVLTNDLEGLGATQARIRDWVDAAQAREAVENAVMERRLSQTDPGDFIGWRANDPNAPRGELAERIEAYRKGRIVPTDRDGKTAKESKTGGLGFWVSVSDLPAPAQVAVRQSERQNRDEAAPNDAAKPSERVLLRVHTGVAFLIPHIGRVEAEGRSLGGRFQELFPQPKEEWHGSGSGSSVGSSDEAPRPVPTFFLAQPGGNVRALLVSLPANRSQAQAAVAAARQHGFNELWVLLPVGGPPVPPLLKQTVALAKPSGLRVQAVARLLRRPARESPDLPRDLTIERETTTQRTRHLLAHPVVDKELVAFGRYSGLRNETLARRAAQARFALGDLLDGGDARVQASVLQRLGALGRVPGLAGIVTRDAAAQLSDEVGYTARARLRFLQQTGLDPVDLSGYSDGFHSYNYGQIRTSEMALPQFPSVLRAYEDEPHGADPLVPSAGALNTKNAWRLWNAFRLREAEALWNRLQKEARNSALRVPLLRQNADRSEYLYEEDPIYLSFIGSWDKFPQTLYKPPHLPPHYTFAEYTRWRTGNVLGEARQNSRRTLLTFHFGLSATYPRYGPPPAPRDGKTMRQQNARLLADRMIGFLQSYHGGWDGFVLDLQDVPLADALPLLRYLPANPTTPMKYTERASAAP